MPIALYRIDDRLIHGQVVVGWGQPLELRFIVLVDDEVAGSEWEQELYRMGVPPDMSVYFHGVDDAVPRLAAYERMPEPGIVLTGNIATMQRLVAGAMGQVRAVNVSPQTPRPAPALKSFQVLFSSFPFRFAAWAREPNGAT